MLRQRNSWHRHVEIVVDGCEGGPLDLAPSQAGRLPLLLGRIVVFLGCLGLGTEGDLGELQPLRQRLLGASDAVDGATSHLVHLSLLALRYLCVFGAHGRGIELGAFGVLKLDDSLGFAASQVNLALALLHL